MLGSNNNIDWRYAITGLKTAGLRVAALKLSPRMVVRKHVVGEYGGSKVADTGVVYLYRFVEGATPVRTFLNSYRAHPAGLEHDLHVILKGFPDRQALAAARALFGSLPINTIEVDDTGYDIGSYVAAAKSVANRKLLFLNTFSEILADNWLAHFDRALNMPGRAGRRDRFLAVNQFECGSCCECAAAQSAALSRSLPQRQYFSTAEHCSQKGCAQQALPGPRRGSPDQLESLSKAAH